jgi:hypothetical protein
MGVYFRIAPGLKLRASKSGLRVGVGPRAGRLWFGAGGTGASTGAGPVSFYRSLGRTSRGRTTTTSMAAYERQMRQTQQIEELKSLAERLQKMITVHQQAFPPAQPPVAPSPEPVDRQAIEKRHRREALEGISILGWSARKQAKEGARNSAEQEIAEEEARRQRLREETQRALDESWRKLLDNDPETVLATLEDAFADNEAPATPVDCQGGRVTTIMLLDGPDSIPERVPKLTSTGKPSSRKLNKTERNELYLGWMSSNLLATIREAFAVAPSIHAVTVVVLRREPMSPFGEERLSVIYAGTLPREQTNRIVWDQPEALDAIFHADNLLIETKGRTKELVPVNLESHPDLAEMVEQVKETLSQTQAVQER